MSRRNIHRIVSIVPTSAISTFVLMLKPASESFFPCYSPLTDRNELYSFPILKLQFSGTCQEKWQTAMLMLCTITLATAIN